MIEEFTMPRKLAHELLGALFNGPCLSPAGYEALKQDFAARMRAAPARREGYVATNQHELTEVLGRIVAESSSPPASPVNDSELLLTAGCHALLALAHAAERSKTYRLAFDALEAAINAAHDRRAAGATPPTTERN